MGRKFDREDDKLIFTKEARPSVSPHHPRAQGDSTGREVESTLIRVVRENRNIKIFEHTFAIDLITKDGVCHGIITWHAKRGYVLIWAKRTILAAGGCGQVYRETTNPDVATGDGLPWLIAPGAVLQDMEFVQFHPTTLYIAGAVRFLITETVRGEGGILRNSKGARFMPDYHPQAEPGAQRRCQPKYFEGNAEDRTYVRVPWTSATFHKNGCIPASQDRAKSAPLFDRYCRGFDSGAAQRPLYDRRGQGRPLLQNRRQATLRMRRDGVHGDARGEPARQ